MILKKDSPAEKLWMILEQISDPEIPVLSITDLGIVRDIKILPSALLEQGPAVEVIITPTYSGCPAMDMIAVNIKIELLQHGFTNVKISQQLSPAWTTDWMSEKGKERLREYGIAPPQTPSDGLRSDGLPSDRIKKMLFNNELKVECPQCNSKNTKLLSEFGSTSCKALYQCLDCKEPFDYFKCH